MVGLLAELHVGAAGKMKQESYIFRQNPLDSLRDQQAFFLRDLGAALTRIYLDAKRPENEVRFSVAKAPQKQILRPITSDEGRFANSQTTIRVILYSDRVENSDLGSVLKLASEDIPDYLRRGDDQGGARSRQRAWAGASSTRPRRRRRNSSWA